MKKALLSLAVVFAMAAGAIAPSINAEAATILPWSGGTAEPSYDDGMNAYIITGGEELAWFANEVNNGNYTINAVLEADIDLNNIRWTPIGNGGTSTTSGEGTYYAGTFNGEGHTVYNLYCDQQGAGLFGKLNGQGSDSQATIDGVNVSGKITCDSWAGSIAAVAAQWVTITDCDTDVDITCTGSGYSYAGGITGYMGDVVKIQECVNKGDINSTARWDGEGSQRIGRVGGIAGIMYNSSKIIGCANLGNVTGGYYTAGIVGYISVGGSNQGTSGIYNSYNAGDVTGQLTPSAITMGINTTAAADDDELTNVEIKNVYNTGKVTGNYASYAKLITTSSRTTIDSFYSVGEVVNTYNANFTMAFDCSANNTSSATSSISNAYVLDGTINDLTGRNVASSVTLTNVTTKSSEWLKSDAFFENGGFAAFARGGDDINNGYPIIAQRADYSAVEYALSCVPDDTYIFTDESIQVLEDAIAAVEYYLSADNQNGAVQNMADAINNAINNLEVDPVKDFVIRLYEILLDRVPDSGGLADHVANLKGHITGGAQTAYDFVFSEEFKGRNMCDEHFVDYMYNAFLGRDPDDVGKAEWLAVMAAGTTREEVFNGFALSREFGEFCENAGIQQGLGISIPQYGTMPTGPCSIEGCGRTDGVIDFVYRLYDVCLGRIPENGEQSGWVNNLRTHADTGTQCADGFFNSNEYLRENTTDSEYVEDLYNAYFGRTPSQSEVDGWVEALGRESRDMVRAGFSNSEEFATLCRQYGIIR